MADETERKPGFVLNKKEKKPEAQGAQAAGTGEAQPKKKVVVVKRKPGSNVHVVARKSAEQGPSHSADGAQTASQVTPPQNAPAGEPADSGREARPVSAQDSRDDTQRSSQVRGAPSKPQDTRPRDDKGPSFSSGQRGSSVSTFQSVRPNVRAGNLSGGPRNRYGNNSGYGRRDGSSGGFTGAQAREGYQNRERAGGYNGNRGGYNGGSGPRPGFGGPGNRQGYSQNGRPGFNGQGGRSGYGQGGGRPGFGGAGSRPGFGGPGMGVRPTFGDASQLAGNKAPAKKAFKGKKQVYNRKDQEQAFDEEELYQNRKKEVITSAVPDKIDIFETISVADLAKKMNLKANEIIAKLMTMGMMVNINQVIDSDTATILASEYNCEVHLVNLYDETIIAGEEGSAATVRVRPPIVTVMGHVDHGKTKTLDAIRNTNVVAGEAGGITQKIGAYQVSTPKGMITFLDTPGHEAFTMMRARGAQVTDIVVLVVAADDGVMPQTLEAISHAKDAKVPIIVAVNKIDKPEANPDLVMTQLSEQGLTPEAWGGDTQYVNISALKREGIDELLDAILVQAEMLELKAQYDCRAEGKVLESRIDHGRGVVATVVVERGTLRPGDPFVAGVCSGRVRAMFDDHGNKVKEAGPAMPVEVLGIEGMPNAGDPFQVTESDKEAKLYAAKRKEMKRLKDAKNVQKVTIDNLYTTIEQKDVKELKLIIKADLQGSAEALKLSLEKLSTAEIRVTVIHSSAGAINESDVSLAASDDNAIIIAFNVRPTPKAKLLADKESVEIRKYNIIYKCVEEIQQAMEGMLQPDTKEEITGNVEVRETFRVPKVGLIAGCYVTSGIIKKTSSVNVIRDGVVKFTGKVSSLKRFKDDVKEVKEGYECGLGIENWQDLQPGDQIEVFEFVEIKRKLGAALVDERAQMEKAAKEREEAAQAKAAEEEAAREAEKRAAKEAGKAAKAARAAIENGAQGE